MVLLRCVFLFAYGPLTATLASIIVSKAEAALRAIREKDVMGKYVLHERLGVGGMGYMAPEQVQGDALDGRADLFALGLTLHEALTGHPALHGHNQAALMAASMQQPVMPPSHFVPEVSRALDIMGLLRHDRERRTASGEVLHQQLQALTGPEAPLPRGRRQLIEILRELLADPSAPSPVPVDPPTAQTVPIATRITHR